MFIDTHAHLDYADYKDDLEEVIAKATAAGVTRILTVGTSLESSRQAVALSERFAGVYAVVGIHPTNVAAEPRDFYSSLQEIAEHPKVVAIGETGLDYHHLPSEKLQPSAALEALGCEFSAEPEGAVLDGAYKALQTQAFLQHLDLAVKLRLNVVLHQRDAWEDTLRYLAPYNSRLRAVFHCFGGTAQEAMQVIEQGHIISFTGIVTFKNAHNIRTTVAAVSANGYMLETDCPYLAPVPYRGKRCEPAHVRNIAELISQVRGESLDAIARQTTATAEEFFRLIG
ncbi:MAG: TatD family deoxyribonuclease [Verrucomicrobia bacterium]|nr:MAG: TatD family deoxyribonuclease [Verrucomicrobiota bacterium]